MEGKEYSVSKYDCNNCASSHSELRTKFCLIFLCFKGSFSITQHFGRLDDISVKDMSYSYNMQSADIMYLKSIESQLANNIGK